MKDSLLWQAATAEAENALAMLRNEPPADPATRRRQMARAANKLQKAGRMLVGWDEATL